MFFLSYAMEVYIKVSEGWETGSRIWEDNVLNGMLKLIKYVLILFMLYNCYIIDIFLMCDKRTSNTRLKPKNKLYSHSTIWAMYNEN